MGLKCQIRSTRGAVLSSHSLPLDCFASLAKTRGRARCCGRGPAHRALFLFRLGVMAHMVFRGFARVVSRMEGVRMRAMGMVGRSLMRARCIMACGLFMMLRSMLVMLGSFCMMLLCGMLGHADLSVSGLYCSAGGASFTPLPAVNREGLFSKNVPDKDVPFHGKLPPGAERCEPRHCMPSRMVKQRETFPWQG
jgi:hypothetical protein